jgi:hypothetical protein
LSHIQIAKQSGEAFCSSIQVTFDPTFSTYHPFLGKEEVQEIDGACRDADAALGVQG